MNVFKVKWHFDPFECVPDHVTFLNQVTYSGNLVQTELPIERNPNQITFGWTVLPSRDSPVFPQMQIVKEAPLKWG